MKTIRRSKNTNKYYVHTLRINTTVKRLVVIRKGFKMETMDKHIDSDDPSSPTSRSELQSIYTDDKSWEDHDTENLDVILKDHLKNKKHDYKAYSKVNYDSNKLEEEVDELIQELLYNANDRK